VFKELKTPETSQTDQNANSMTSSTIKLSQATEKLAPILSTMSFRGITASEHLLNVMIASNPNDPDLEIVLLHAIECGMDAIAKKIIPIKGAENSLPAALSLLQSDRAQKFTWEGTGLTDTYKTLITELSNSTRTPLNFDQKNITKLQEAMTYMVINKQDEYLTCLLQKKDIIEKINLNALLMLALEHRRSKMAALCIKQGAKNLPSAFLTIQNITGSGRYNYYWDENGAYETIRAIISDALAKSNYTQNATEKANLQTVLTKLIESNNVRSKTELLSLLSQDLIVTQIDLNTLLLKAFAVKHGEAMSKLVEKGATNFIPVLLELQSQPSTLQSVYNAVYYTWKTGTFETVYHKMILALVNNPKAAFTNDADKSKLLQIITFLIQNPQTIQNEKNKNIDPVVELFKNKEVVGLITNIIDNQNLNIDDKNAASAISENNNQEKFETLPKDVKQLLQTAILYMITKKAKSDPNKNEYSVEPLLEIASIRKAINLDVLIEQAITVLEPDLVTVLLGYGTEKLSFFLCKALSMPPRDTSQVLNGELQPQENLTDILSLIINAIVTRFQNQKISLSVDEVNTISGTLLALSKETNIHLFSDIKKQEFVLSKEPFMSYIKIRLFVLALIDQQDFLAGKLYKTISNENIDCLILAIHQMQVDCTWENLTKTGQLYYNNLISFLKKEELFISFAEKPENVTTAFSKVMAFMVFQDRLTCTDYFNLPHLSVLINHGQLLVDAVKFKKITLANGLLVKLKPETNNFGDYLLKALEASVAVHDSILISASGVDKTLLLSMVPFRQTLCNLFTQNRCVEQEIFEKQQRLQAILMNMTSIGDTESVIALFSVCEPNNIFFGQLLKIALEKQNADVTNLLGSKKAENLSEILNNMLKEFVIVNNVRACKFIALMVESDLTAKTIELDGSAYSPLVYAIKKGWYELVNMLLNDCNEKPQDYVAALTAEDARKSQNNTIRFSTFYTALETLTPEQYTMLRNKAQSQNTALMLD
jgi:hypothetical protein